MKITFDSIEQNRNVDKGYMDHKNTYRATADQANRNQSSVAVDIADRVMDNGAYRSQGKTMQDVSLVAQGEDATVQKNYMTVMSHSVSEEDLKEMEKDGYKAGDMDVDSYVTIVDKIKVTLAEAGVTIDGYNDDLDADKVAKITGSVTAAKEITDAFDKHQIPKTQENYEKAADSYQKAASLSSLKDSTELYMIQNEKEPTIENLFLSQFCTTNQNRQTKGYFSDGTGYYARKAEDYNWEQLEGQIAKVCENAGFAKNDIQALDNGKWLIQNGIPLTEDNLLQLTELEEMTFPMDGTEIAENIAIAMENGKEPQQALLSGEISYSQQGKELLEQVASITPEAVDATVSKGKRINIKNLSTAQRQITEESINQQDVAQKSQITEKNNDQQYMTQQNQHAKRQLAEIQLTMTVEANRKLLSSGYQIETTDLEKLIQDLKQVEASQNAAVFHGTDEADNTTKAALFEETNSKAAQMAFMPAAVIGQAIKPGEKFTINYVVEEGSTLKKSYDAAGQSYEALMTVPRKDLGDSIKKAFSNVDEILKSMNQETTEDNRRAVRILGYNQMEMNQKNLDAVKHADLEVNSVMKKLTPGATLSMIRENVNPLTMSVSELNQYLSSKEQSNVRESEKYSEYLYKLEQNHEITPEERDSYIGIYRLCRQIEKGDGAAIGTIINNGSELSMSNLLSAIRSQKAKGMDIKINDTFGTLDDIHTTGKSISDQIDAGFSEEPENESDHSNSQSQSDQTRAAYEKKIAGEIKDTLLLQPEILSGVDLDKIGDMTLIQLKNALQNADNYGMREERSNAYSQQYYQETLDNIQKLQNCEEAVVQELMDYKQPVTMDNLLAMTVLTTDRGSTFSKVSGIATQQKDAKATNVKENDFLQSLDALEEQNEVADQYRQSVKDLTEQFTEAGSAKKAYEEMITKAENVLEQSVDSNTVNSLDVKAVNLLYKQLSLASGLAKEENYEVPISIDGEETSMNLRVMTGTKEKGKVVVTMDTKSLGKVAAEFDVRTSEKGVQCNGFIACDSKEGITELQKKKEEMMVHLQHAYNSSKEGEDTDAQIRIQVVSTNTLDISRFGQRESIEDNDTIKSREARPEEISTKDLYQTAKAFIQTFA